MIRKIFHKIYAAFKAIFIYKNWLAIYGYYLKFFGKPYFIMKLRNGVNFKIRGRRQNITDSYIVNEIWLYGVHDGLKPYLKSAKIGIDIGAHIGVFSVFAANRSPDLKIFAYEPAVDNFSLLQENIKLNNLKDRISAIHKAVCGVSGSREFYLPKDSGLYTLNQEYARECDERYTKTLVECQSLADFFKFNKIGFCDFIKIDCEGGEYEILYSASKETFSKIGVLSIECHKGGSVVELRKFLENNGFQVSSPHKRSDVLLAVNQNKSLL